MATYEVETTAEFTAGAATVVLEKGESDHVVMYEKGRYRVSRLVIPVEAVPDMITALECFLDHLTDDELKGRKRPDQIVQPG